MFEHYWGNSHAVRALEGMIAHGRIPQTLLFAGPEGVGKATLARRFAQALLPHPELIERDDLSLPENARIVADREKWTAEKRNEDPLLFATHPDFITVPPDGPLRQLSIPQMRVLKERAQFLPNRGDRRVFLIDHIDRSGEQAANSLLKILEEPPPYLILIATAGSSLRSITRSPWQAPKSKRACCWPACFARAKPLCESPCARAITPRSPSPNSARRLLRCGVSSR